jgi:hypothetical protein
MALAILLVGATVVLIGRLGTAAADRAGARAAADAAALAGAADGEGSARELAAANGAEMTGFVVDGADAQVEVRLGSARAVGRARRSNRVVGGRGDDGTGVAPAMRAALGRAGELLGSDVPVAVVHPPGLAVDVAAAVVDRLARVAPSAGLCRPRADTHPTLFEVCQAGGGDP